MMFKNRLSLFVATFLIISFFFLALPEKGYSGINGNSQLGCCIERGVCIGCGSLDCTLDLNECLAMGGDNSALNQVCQTNGGCAEPAGLGCCVLSEGNCNENQEFVDCDGEGIAWFFKTDCSEFPECAPLVTNVPTLSEWGLIAMAGIVGFMVIRRKKATA